jgi:hypothetical protein
MTQTKASRISEDARLNDIEFRIDAEWKIIANPVLSKDSGISRQVPGKEFYLTMPYRVDTSAEGQDCLARSFGRMSFDTAFSTATEGNTNKKMTREKAIKYAERYLGVEGYLSSDQICGCTAFISSVELRMYEAPQPTLDGKLPLNAFEVKGYVIRPLNISDYGWIF